MAEHNKNTPGNVEVIQMPASSGDVVDRPLSSGNLPGEKNKKKTNGAKVVRYTSLMQFLCCIGLSLTMVNMCRVGRYEQGSDSADQDTSATIIFLTTIAIYMAYRASKDLFQTWKNTKNKWRLRTWDEQHKSFVRMCIPFAYHTIVFPCTFMLFLLQSKGYFFWDLVSQIKAAGSDYYNKIVYLCVTAALLLTFAGILLMHIKFAIDKGYGTLKPNATAADMKCRCTDITSKLLAVAGIIILPMFSYCVIECIRADQNSGVITFAVLCLMSFMYLLLFLVRLLCRSRQLHGWWLVFRLALGGVVVMSFFTFWIALTSYSLLGTGEDDGFFAAINGLNYTRRWNMYTHMIIYFIYLLLVLYRSWALKLRKHMRQPPVLLAVQVVLNDQDGLKKGLLEATSDTDDVKEQALEAKQEEAPKQPEDKKEIAPDSAPIPADAKVTVLAADADAKVAAVAASDAEVAAPAADAEVAAPAADAEVAAPAAEANAAADVNAESP